MENADVPSHPRKQGFEEIPQDENAENADNKPRKIRKVRLTGFISCVALRGFALRGLGDVRGFPFCGGKKGLRLPLAVEKGV